MKDLRKFYIDGQWIDPVQSNDLDVENPASEELVATISLGAEADVNHAVAAARRAFPGYSQMPVDERISLMEKLLQIYVDRYDEMAVAISIEMGAPISFATAAQADTGRGHINSAIEALKQLEEQKKKISSNNLTIENPALVLADWIKGIPMIYYPWGLQAAAIRFKNSLQENAKLHAVAEDIIEACHNGIVSWSKFSDIKPIFIRGKDDYIKTDERWEILKDYFEKEGIDYREVFSLSGNILTKLINLIYLFDYASIYKAISMEVDPTPVKAIDFIKDRL